MGKKILIVDDEELIIRSLSKVLDKEGYEVYVIKNPQDALVAVEEEDFDLLIVDIKMPGMNGIELVKRIKKEGKDVPIVFITGYSDENIKREIKNMGDKILFVEKPFDIKEFVGRIREIV